MIRYRHLFEAIGTAWEIEYEGTDDGSLEQVIRARIDAFDRVYSRFRNDSLITKMSYQAGRYTLPDDARRLIDWYRTLYDITGGAVTPLIGQTLHDAGYDASYSLQPGTVRRPPAWDDVMEYTPPDLVLHQPALLDFGAAGKGYLTDLVAEILQDAGSTEYCINAGGDIVHYSGSGNILRVGLEHPDDPTLAVGVTGLGNRSICGSSGNRRTWGKYHHIIDPDSLRSPRHISAVWAVADCGLVADGLSTALYFINGEELQHRLDQAGGPAFEYAIMYSGGRFEYSKTFPAEIFTVEQAGTVH